MSGCDDVNFIRVRSAGEPYTVEVGVLSSEKRWLGACATPFEDDRVAFDFYSDPVESVGGDYCHVEYVGRRRLAIHVSDVTGHGPEAASLSSRTSVRVRKRLSEGEGPGRILEDLNGFLCRRFRATGMLMSFHAIVIDLSRRTLRWAGAGHPPAFLIPPRGRAIPLPSENPILGAGPYAGKESERRLTRGSLVAAFTDGLYERRNGGSRGLSRILRRLESLRDAPVRKIVESMRRASSLREDDALFLAVRVK